MKPRLILLTDKAFLPDLAARLAPPAGPVEALFCASLADLAKALAQDASNARIVSCGSGVIIPPEVLKTLPGPAYNLHPGPPEYRGLFPSVFALYDNATEFGVTCHEMTAEIDSGPIVAVKRFPIPPHFDRAQLDAATYGELLTLIEQLAPRLADIAQPLAPIHQPWSGPLRRKADFAALCRLPAKTDEAEFKRRLRAVGEGPHHALTMEIDGKIVKLDSGRSGLVVRGGKPVAL